jgi:hypothetical protein
MSRTVTGYLNGRPLYRDDGPAVARRQGFGGSAMGWFSGTVVTCDDRPAAATAAAVGPPAGHSGL